jgi:alkanesulfonate monooxygenase SsuD/methylene tetrahydromethanopterin reductase-like flavin-dependent oxidoreductase (luciferase family)
MPVKFGMSIVPHAPMTEQIQLAVLSERLGFDSAWWPDHMLFTDHAPAVDCWTVMAAAAVKTTKIKLGTSVSDPHRVHPAVFAQRAATLDTLSQGRLLVGLGSGESMNLDPFGIPWNDRKVGRLREFIQVFRGLTGSGGPFNHQGPLYQLKDAVLSIKPYKNREIPLYIASLGPQMQKLTGQVGQGWMPVVIPAPYYAHYFEPIAASAREHGRDPAHIERTVQFAFALIEGKKQLSTAELARAVRPFAGILVWEPAVRQMGLDWSPPEHLKDMCYHTVNPCDPESMRRFEEYANSIPDEVLVKFVVAGDRSTIRQAARDYVQAGVNHFLVINASPDPLTSTFWFAHELMPEFSGKSPTLWARSLTHLVKPFAKLGLTRKVVPADLDIWKKVGL